MGEIRQRRYWYSYHCQQCGEDFKATRKDARFCGSTCRSFAHRAEKDTAAPSAPSSAYDELRQALAKK